NNSMSNPRLRFVGELAWSSTATTFVPGGNGSTATLVGKKTYFASPFTGFKARLVKVIGPDGMFVRNASLPFTHTTAPPERERRKSRLVRINPSGTTNVRLRYAVAHLSVSSDLELTVVNTSGSPRPNRAGPSPHEPSSYSFKVQSLPKS